MNETRNEEDIAKYKKLNGIAQKTIKLAESNQWKAFCQSLDDSSKLRSVWKMSKKMAGNESGNINVPILLKDDRQFDEDESKANLLAQTFASASSDDSYSKQFR